MTTSTKAKPTTTEATGYVRRTEPLTNEERRAQLAANPNPDTVNIEALIAAARAEAKAAAVTDNPLREAFNRIRPDGDAWRWTRMLAEYPQWDPETENFHSWVRNPRLPAATTTVQTEHVMDAFKWLISNYGDPARTAVDNVCGAVGLTYARMEHVWRCRIDLPITEQMFRACGYDPASYMTDPDSDSAKELAMLVLRDRVRRRNDFPGLTLTAETVNVA